jgi:hypothetical protein
VTAVRTSQLGGSVASCVPLFVGVAVAVAVVLLVQLVGAGMGDVIDSEPPGAITLFRNC